MAKVPKLGTGKRFAKLENKLAAKGATNPGALAAYIGRKKFGVQQNKSSKVGKVAMSGAKPKGASGYSFAKKMK